jgi:putative transposase
MNNYNPNIRHRKSIRLKGYDYSQSGLYFLTICLQDRRCLFGKIVDGKMNLNDAGKISDECWLGIPRHFPNAVLHEHIIMPNHVHGIIELIKPCPQTNESGISVGVENIQPQRNEYQKIIPHSIGSIVRGFKTGFTKWYRNNSVGVQNFEPLQSSNESSSIGVENFQPLQSPNESLLSVRVQNFEPRRIWQRNYYEHIIRNENAYHRIADYIINNPQNWEKDKFFDCD